MSSRIRFALVATFVVLVVAFFALYLRDLDYSTFEELTFTWWLVLLATVISVAFRFWGVLIWKLILRDLGATSLPSFPVLGDIYAKAWMGRYIPGTVAWIGGKIYLASRQGIAKSKLAVSSLLEAGMQIVAAMSVSLLILGLDPRLDVISTQVKVAMVVLAVGMLAILLPPVFNTTTRLAFRLIRREAALQEVRTNSVATVRSFVLYAIGTLIAGTSYFFLTKALYPPINAAEHFWFIVGAFTLAGALGMATPLLPSGIGVRDGVQLVLLSLIMPTEIALAVTVASRLWSALVDLVFLAAAIVARRVWIRVGADGRDRPDRRPFLS